MASLKTFLSNPLLHFLLIGASLFLLYDMVKPARGGQDTIIIDDDLVKRSIGLFRKEWGRPPSKEELEGLVDRQIQQEVLYRQALKMNLDHNDELIRRRMEQKLTFITNDLATMREPPEDSLKAYMFRHSDKYKLPEKLDFLHIYFNPDKRTDARGDATRVLAGLPVADPHPDSRLKEGDMYPFLQKVVDMDRKSIIGQMGEEFAEAVLELPVGKWAGPLVSGLGTHLVFVDRHTPSAQQEWSAVRADVLRDYQYDLSQEYNRKVYEDFRKQYKVHVLLQDTVLKALGMEEKFSDHD
jgi:hypothetical protein